MFLRQHKSLSLGEVIIYCRNSSLTSNQLPRQKKRLRVWGPKDGNRLSILRLGHWTELVFHHIRWRQEHLPLLAWHLGEEDEELRVLVPLLVFIYSVQHLRYHTHYQWLMDTPNKIVVHKTLVWSQLSISYVLCMTSFLRSTSTFMLILSKWIWQKLKRKRMHIKCTFTLHTHLHDFSLHIWSLIMIQECLWRNHQPKPTAAKVFPRWMLCLE